METSREMGLTLVIPFYSSSTAAENILTLVAGTLHGGLRWCMGTTQRRGSLDEQECL